MIRLQEMVRFYIAWHNLPSHKIIKEIGIDRSSIRRFLREDGKVSDKTLLKVMDWAIQQIPEEEKGIYTDPVRNTNGKKPATGPTTESSE